MEYLSGGERPYVHRDLAARNILIDSRMQVKISNIGIARAETTSDYFNPQIASDSPEPTQTLIPVRWMSPESLLEANYTTVSLIFFKIFMPALKNKFLTNELTTLEIAEHPNMTFFKIIIFSS